MHIKGSQGKPHEEVNIWECINDECEREPGEFWVWCVQQLWSKFCITFPLEPWVVWQDGKQNQQIV
jgi:hypothetical protein